MVRERILSPILKTLPVLPVRAADLDASPYRRAFSRGARVMKYRSSELGFKKGGRTARAEVFLSWLAQMEARIGTPVPYVFSTSDGEVRSIDAGVLGYLFHAAPRKIDLIDDADGFIVAIRTAQSLGAKARPAGEFTMPDLCARGQAPAMAYLLETVTAGEERVTYGQLAAHLNAVLGLSNVTHHHVGDVIDAMMRRIQQVEVEAPLLNVMVVRGDAREPGVGADAFLKRRYALQRLAPAERPGFIRRALNEIRSFRDWDDLYQRAYGTARPTPRNRLDQFDDDGQPDNPKYGGRLGGLESAEHKRLKAYVRDNPHELRLKLAQPHADIERPLHSGDRMDVEIIDGARWIAVEVKSIRSGDDDLRRGLFQCIKYKAVMKAQSSLAVAAECDAILVTERPLPDSLRRVARQLGVRHLVLKVN